MTEQHRIRCGERPAEVGRRARGSAAVRFIVVVTAAGAILVAGRAQAQADAMGLAPPRAVSATTAQAGLGVRTQRLRERYARWQDEHATAAHGDALPVPPSNAQAPPAPDAPDGEITRQTEEAGQ